MIHKRNKLNYNKIISLLLTTLMLFTTLSINVNRVEAKEIGKKNEKACDICGAITKGDVPKDSNGNPYIDVLDNGSVFMGGNSLSGVIEPRGKLNELDNDKNDFANPLPYGNVYIDTSKITWSNPNGFIIDIQDDRIKWVDVDGRVHSDKNGRNTTTNDPLGSDKPLSKGNLDDGSEGGFIAYVGELKPYHDDIRTETNNKGYTNVIEGSPYLYKITYLNAATLADGSRGNVVMTMTKIEIETSISVSENDPNILKDKDGNTYQYTKAILPIQSANQMKVAGGVTDSEGNWVNKGFAVAKTQAEVQEAINTANANLPAGAKIGNWLLSDKYIRHTIGEAYYFSIEVVDSEGESAKGTMSYAAHDLDLPSYQTIWGRDRETDPFMYAEGLTILSGTESYALVPNYNHSNATTLVKGWVADGVTGSLDHPLNISGGNGNNADGVRFSSNGEKVLRDKSGLWTDSFFKGPQGTAGDKDYQPGTIVDFTWDNINNARIRYKNISDIETYINSQGSNTLRNIRQQLAGKIKDANDNVVPYDQITVQQIIDFIGRGSYAVERNDNDNGFDSGFAVLLNPEKSELRWTGSSYQNGSAVTTLFDSTLYTYVEQTHGTGGGIYLESYNLESNNLEDKCKPVMNEGTVTMGRNSETTVTAVPEEGYRISKITIGNTNYKDHSKSSLTDFETYTIDGNKIKDINGKPLATFDPTTNKAEVNGFYYDKNDARQTHLNDKQVKFIFEKNADGTIDVTLPNVDNPMHVHADFGADYYFYKVWVGNDEPTELNLIAAPYRFIPTEVTIPMPNGVIIDGIEGTEDVKFTIDKHEYTATTGTYRGKVFKLTPNQTLLYIETDSEGQETLRVESTYKLEGNEFVNETSGDRREVTIQERIADWKSNYAVSFTVDDSSEYADYVTVSTEDDKTVWKIRYPSEGVTALGWDPLPVDVTGERDDNHDAVTHIDRNYWFVIEENVPAWALESYDNSDTEIPGVVPDVEGKDHYYNDTHWAKDAIKDVEDATTLVKQENKNTAAFLSVFKDGGKITNVPMVIVEGTKEWDDFDNKYNNRKDIWLHVDASIENSDGSTTSYKDVLPAQKVAKDATGNDLTKTWGDKTVYDTGVDNVKVVASRKDIPSDAKKQENGSFILNETTYWVNELKKVNKNGIEYTYSIRETLDREGKQPIAKDNPDEGLLGYTSEADVISQLDTSTIKFENNNDVTKYSGTIKNELATIEYKATKFWDDYNDQDGYRTDIKFVLEGLEGNLPNNQKKTIDISKEKNETTVTWTSLPKYENGAIVPYTVSEQGMDEEHYTLIHDSNVDEKGNITDVLTNKHTPETASLSIFKVWDDDNNRDGFRTDGATVKLEGKTEADGDQWKYVTDKDGNPISSNAAVPTENGLVITWLDLPVKRKGQQIEYRISEDISETAGYHTEYKDNKQFSLVDKENKEVEITNKRDKEVTKITITKVWEDSWTNPNTGTKYDNHDNIRPESITVQLVKKYNKLSTGTKEVDKVITIDSNPREYKVYITNDNDEYFIKDGKYYKADDINGVNRDITDYKELIVFNPTENDQAKVTRDPVMVIDEKEYDVYYNQDNSIKYSAVPDETGENYTFYNFDTAEVIENAQELGLNPDADELLTEVKQEYVADGEKEYPIMISADGTEYYIKEDNKYYDLAGIELTKFNPTESNVVKEIVEDKQGYVEDFEEIVNITLNDENDWTYSDDELPVNEREGQVVGYTVKEESVPDGYEATVVSDEAGNWTVTNKHEVIINPPKANPDESEDWRGIKQTGVPTFTADPDTKGPGGTENKIERITLVDENGNEVNEITVPGEGTYVLTDNGNGTCSILFTPEKDFVGKTNGVKVRGYDSNEMYADTTYTPTVIMKVEYIDPLSNDPDTPVDKGVTEKDKTGSDVTTTYEDTPGKESKQHPGFRFDGWDEKEVTLDTGEIKLVRTAKYTPMHNINYDPNGGTGYMPDNDYPADEPNKPHDKNTFTRKGYTFTGFKAYITDPTTGVETPIVDENGDPIIFQDSNDMAQYFKDMPGGTSIRMEAQWKRNEYHIKYDPNGGSGIMTGQDFTGDDTSAISKTNTFTRGGYEFTGFKAVDMHGNYIGFFTSVGEFIEYLHALGDGGEIILIAQWRIHEENRPSSYSVPKTGIE